MMKNYKGILRGAVAYSVIIGVIYVTLSLLGLLARWCVFDVENFSPFIYMLYLLYFRERSCEETLNWESLNINSDVSVIMADESDVVQRTTTIFIIYLVLHSALVLISLYALCGVNNSCLGRRSFGLYFVPWIMIWIAIIVLDIAATVFFSLDAVNAQTSEGLMDLLGIEFSMSVLSVFEENRSFLVFDFPPIMMAIVAAKFALFLLANIAWTIAIARGGWAAATYHKYVDNSRRNYENNMGNQNPAFEDFEPKNQTRNFESEQPQSVHELSVSPSGLKESAESRYNDTSTRVQGFVYTSNRQQNNQGEALIEEEIKYKIQRPNVSSPERSASVMVHQYEKTSYRSESVDPEIENRLSRFQESNGVVIRTVEPLKYDDIPEQQKSIIGIKVLPTAPINRSQSEIKSKPVPPPKPNNRFSVQPMVEIDEPVLYRSHDRTNSAKVERNSSSIKPVPVELRNQFAFNYLDPNNQVPKRAFQNLSEDEEPPTVPVPDYTLHFPQNGRRRTNLASSDEDYSSQYSQQNQQRY